MKANHQPASHQRNADALAVFFLDLTRPTTTHLEVPNPPTNEQHQLLSNTAGGRGKSECDGDEGQSDSAARGFAVLLLRTAAVLLLRAAAASSSHQLLAAHRSKMCARGR